MFSVKQFTLCLYIVLCALLETYALRNIANVFEHCKIRKNQKLVCHVGPTSRLDFRDIRLWTDKFPGTQVKVICNEGGTVFLPWPVKAKNLRRFHIQGCFLKGFFTEYKTDYPVPDSIVDLRIIDCTVETNIMDTLRMISRIGQFSKSFDCGQLTVKTLMIRNMTYFFNRTPGDIETIEKTGALKNAGHTLLEESKAIKHTCVYTNLINMDSSISASRSKFHFQLSTENSEYPELRYYNFSCNSLSELPVQLKDWSAYYPKLEYLDLAKNRLRTFDFLPYRPNNGIIGRELFLYVDLRNNLIERVPMSISQMIRDDIHIIVDLRNNPIHCDCQVIYLKSYLDFVALEYPMYHYDLKCASPPALKGQSVTSLTSKKLGCIL